MSIEPDVEADVRRYLVRTARWIAPPVALAMAAILVIALVAITGRTSPSTSSGVGVSGPSAAPTGASPGTSAPQSVGTHGSSSLGSGAQGTSAAAGGLPPVSSGPVTQTGSASGVARSGVVCAPEARQVPWTKYAPYCVARFTGSNGGATAPGVTASTITLSYRRQNSGEQAAISAIAGAATPDDTTYLEDLNTYLALFNSEYELYGRRVVLKPFNGQGDYLQEDLGQDQEAAQADAVTAHQEGAFADVTFPSATSLAYSQALAASKVVNWGFPVDPESWYQQYRPYEYSVFLDGSKWAEWAADMACQRMVGLPATFAGDPSLQGKPRVFGLIDVEFPTWEQATDLIASRLASQCGIKIARRESYPENIGEFQQNGSSMAAQMRAAGVTTVICFCDPLMPIFITQSATQQGYRPEWIFQNDFDPIAQDTDQTQFAHALAPGPAVRVGTDSEAYRAYELANPGRAPASIYYQGAYEELLQLFGGLQAAGPDLTPATFEQGVFSLPPSLPGGDYGDWSYGPGAYTPLASVQIVYWDPTRPSIDGKQGSWTACESGSAYPLVNPPAWGAPHTQLHCFGR